MLHAALPAVLALGLAPPDPPVEFTIAASDLVPRYLHRAGRLDDGTVLVSGGVTLQVVPASLVTLADLTFYDPKRDAFSRAYAPPGGAAPTTPALRVPRSSHTQTALPGGCVLFAGGQSGANGRRLGTAVASAEVFDPATGAVSDAPPMSEARYGHTASILPGGRVIVAGGRTWQVFDPATDTWSEPVELLRTRTAHAAVVLSDHAGPGGHRVLLIAGAGNGGDTLELIDPAARGSRLVTARLPAPLDDLAAVPLHDGTVLIVGGQDLRNGDTVDQVWRFRPDTGELLPAPAPPALPGGIADHALVRVGELLMVLGGERQVSGVDTELDYAAAFDPQASRWIWTSRMTFPHDDAAVVVLPGDEVLVIGGGAPAFGHAVPTANVERLRLGPP